MKLFHWSDSGDHAVGRADAEVESRTPVASTWAWKEKILVIEIAPPTAGRGRLTRFGAPMWVVLVAAYMACPATCAGTPPPPQPCEERIESLLGRMTLTEKLGQLTQLWGGDRPEITQNDEMPAYERLSKMIRAGTVGAILHAHGATYTNRLQRLAVEESRLGIPLLFGNDVIHGYLTIFPIPLAETSSWDPELVRRAARATAEEARAAGTHWTFAPMVDICRDPRWGRIAEGSGEDPHMGSVMAAARVRGFQGDDLAAPDAILACAKHFAAYGAAEGGRDYNTVDLSGQTLRDVFLPPFKAAVDAGVGTLMSAFNEINGVPATANPLILKRILRDEWNFRGFVVSDWTAVTEMVDHGFAVSDMDAAEKAIRAGVDMDMSSSAYVTHLGEAVKAGRVAESIVDEAVRRVLRAKCRLGLFEKPYAEPQREQAAMLSHKNRRLAREVAGRSIVLLKNHGGILPINRNIQSLAVIGPLADSRKDPLGAWATVGVPSRTVATIERSVVTVLEGIKAAVPSGTNVSYARGSDAESDDKTGFAEAIALAGKSDMVVLVVGETQDMSGEARCRSSLDLPSIQQALIKAVHASGVPTVVVLMNGRPLSIRWTADHVPAILEAWHLGVECGHAVADVLFGDVNPGGKLPVTFPRTVGQIPIYYNHKNTGRPPEPIRFTSKYIDLPSTPLFPFGWGLSYTKFEFTNLTINPGRMARHGRIKVSVDVRNVGGREGDEVVQLYIRDLVGSMTRPVRELKGFRRIHLESGEQKTVSFMLAHEQLGFHNRQMQHVVEPGSFKLWVGPSSVEGLEAEFEIVGDPASSGP
jgi:beta-glucosidase